MANDLKSEDQLSRELEAARQVVPLGKYAHYKHPGEARYEVVGVGILENTEGVCVIYKRIDTGWLWVRTLEDFTAEVGVGGMMVRRFQLIK
jgi:hypothetical protein